MYMLILFRGHISLSVNDWYGNGELLNVAMALSLQYIEILKMSKLVNTVYGYFVLAVLLWWLV